MDGEISGAAVLGLLLVVGIVLDVIIGPLPLFASRRQRMKRHGFWAVLITLYLACLLSI